MNLGRPCDPRRQMYADRFYLTEKVAKHGLTDAFLDQLDKCKDDASRRLLLGVSR
jgi:hypothetical protein